MGTKRTDEFGGWGAYRAEQWADTQAGCFRFGCRVTAHRDTELVPDKDLDLARETERLRRESRILKDLQGIVNTMDLSRFCAVPGSRLSHFPFESGGAFPAQC